MNEGETERLIFGLLTAFLSDDNTEREQAEILYDQLEGNDPNLMSKMLRSVVSNHPKNFECLLALIKLADMILGSLIGDDCGLSNESLTETRAAFLAVVTGPYPRQIKEYVLSVIDNFLYISDARQDEWPELFPFFMGLLESGKEVEYALGFFSTLIQIHASEDCSLMVFPKLVLEGPDQYVTLASLRFLISDLYNNPRTVSCFSSIPEIFASLPDDMFGKAFNWLWKLIKRAPELFDDMSAELVGMLLRVAGDASCPELQRVAAVYYFGKLIRFSGACAKLVRATVDSVLKVFVNCLLDPKALPDLYREAKDVLGLFVDDLVELDSYCEHENDYVASVFVRFIPDTFSDVVTRCLASGDTVLIENALEALDGMCDYSDDVVQLLVNGLKAEQWRSFVVRLSKWCFECPDEKLEARAPEIDLRLLQLQSKPETMLCQAVLASRGYGRDKVPVLFEQIQKLFGQSKGEPQLLEVLAKIIPVVDPKEATRFLYTVMPTILDDMNSVNSPEFCFFLVASGELILPFISVVVDVLLDNLKNTDQPSDSVETLCNLIDLCDSSLDDRIDNLCDCAVQFLAKEPGELRLLGFKILSSIVSHFWACEKVQRKVEELLPAHIETETDLQCYDLLILIIMRVIEDESTPKAFLNVILDQTTVIISKAVESDSETIFAGAGSIFAAMLKVLPEDATKIFFQIQKVFPRYDQPDVVGSLRSFSLMMWTDFIIYGRDQDTEQYRHQLANDLKRLITEDPDEKLRLDAILAASVFYNSPKVVDHQVEMILDTLHSVASRKDETPSITTASISCFAQLFASHWNEKNFPKRTQQLFTLLPCPSLSPGPDTDAIYSTVLDLAIIAWRDLELRIFVGPYARLISTAIQHRLLPGSFIASMDRHLHDEFEAIPEPLASIFTP